MENETPTSLRTVLVVNDDEESRVLIKFFLDSVGYVVDLAQNAEEALARFNKDLHDLVLTDNSMPGMSGEEMAHVIKLRSPTTPVIMFSGNPPQSESCIDFVITKPAHLIEIKDAVDKWIVPR